ncbi:hypothetical protein AhyVDH1_002 [Aeromonas phage AhyVDH1]|nr:hypothetical protein AhyVDH1_002 [Aeromonas phage AhyVDH1]
MKKHINLIIIAMLLGSSVAAIWCTLEKVDALDRVAESNHELAEAIHQNTQLMQLIESTPKTKRLH